MTSNLGMQELNSAAKKIGFADKDEQESEKIKLEKEYERIKEGLVEKLKKELRPEFLNRIDKIIIFRPLGITELKKITQLQIVDLQKRLEAQGISLKTTPALIKFITEKSFDPLQGARYIRKNVQDLISDPLAEQIIQQSLKEGATITVGLDSDNVSFKIEQKKVAAVPA